MRILVLVGILLAGVLYFFADPELVPLPDCPFYQVTHLYCPGCGSQRGLHALLNGDFGAAIGYNPLMIFGLIFLLAEYSIPLFNRFGLQMRTLSSRRYTPVIAAMIIVLYWILRNIPVAPFSALAP